MKDKLNRDEERIKEMLEDIEKPEFIYKDSILNRINTENNFKKRRIKKGIVAVASMIFIFTTVVVASEFDFFTKLFERNFGGFRNEVNIIENKDDGLTTVDNNIEIKAEAVGVTSNNMKLILSVKDKKENIITEFTTTKDNIEIKNAVGVVTNCNESFDSENKISTNRKFFK